MLSDLKIRPKGEKKWECLKGDKNSVKETGGKYRKQFLRCY